jgi:molybdopterin-guanine dinucleotide biosynthesis protein A
MMVNNPATLVKPRLPICGVILAGGQSRRYGVNKAFAPLAGKSLIAHVIARAAPQVDGLVISAGDDPRFAAFGLPIVTDDVRDGDGGQAGPLAGVLAALDWMADHASDTRWLASFSTDTPLLPLDMVARLRDAAERQGAVLACSRSAGRLHPLLAIWSPGLRDDLRTALQRGERAVHRFVEGQGEGAAVIDFPAEPFDPFANVNTPADLERLARQLTAESGS